MIATQQAKARLTFRNVLFASDFSYAANCALPYAAGLATSFGARLIALHVQEPANYALPPEMWQSAQQALDLEMEALGKSLHHDFPELKTEVVAGEGGVWPSLAAAVAKFKIDLIVVGTRGRTGMEKVLLGSTAEEILRHSPCPVLTVGPHAQSELGRRGKIVSILYATDFGSSSLAAAPYAVSLAEEFQSKLTLLHVIDQKTAAGSVYAQLVGPCKQQLQRLVPGGAGFWCAPETLVVNGVPKEKILEEANRIGADLVVLGVHSATGVPGAATHLPISTIHHVITHANCPVLTVHK